MSVIDSGVFERRLTDVVRTLWRSGQWDDALTVLEPGHDETAALRAEILVDRFWWRLEGADEARESVANLEAKDRHASSFLQAQLAYTRLVFGQGPEVDDRTRAYEGFMLAAQDDRFAGWATFWLGVFADNVDHDVEAARDAYARASVAAGRTSDSLLSSYVLRHQGVHLMEAGKDADGLSMFRRSLHLRAALGVRPQTAAAAATLADALPAGEEAESLRSSALLTARELQLSWLVAALVGAAQ